LELALRIVCTRLRECDHVVSHIRPSKTRTLGNRPCLTRETTAPRRNVLLAGVVVAQLPVRRDGMIHHRRGICATAHCESVLTQHSKKRGLATPVFDACPKQH